MSTSQRYQIGEVSRISGVSIRSLRHYDEIGLLSPPSRSDAGYRLYTQADLLRLQQILLCRELGLSLDDIRAWLDDPDFDQNQALMRQRKQLQRQLQNTTKMIQAIDRALAFTAPLNKEEGEIDMTTIFEGFDPTQYEQESKQKWGDEDIFTEASRRTASYGDQDWIELRQEAEDIYQSLHALMKKGEPANGMDALAITERHRLHIDKWFYPCDKVMHRSLAQLYESDSRYADNIDKHGQGLTRYLIDSIRASQ